MKIDSSVISQSPSDHLPPQDLRDNAIKAHVFGSLSSAAPTAPVAPIPPSTMSPAQINSYYFLWGSSDLSWLSYYASQGDSADYQKYMTNLTNLMNTNGIPPELKSILSYVTSNYQNNMSQFVNFWDNGDPNFVPPYNIPGVTTRALSQYLLSFMASPPPGSYDFSNLTPNEVMFSYVFMLGVTMNPNAEVAPNQNIDTYFWGNAAFGSPNTPSDFAILFSQTACTWYYQQDLTSYDGSPPTQAQIAQFMSDMKQLNGFVQAAYNASPANGNFRKAIDGGSEGTTNPTVWEGFNADYQYFTQFGSQIAPPWPAAGIGVSTLNWGDNPPNFPYYWTEDSSGKVTIYDEPTDEDPTIPSNSWYMQEPFHIYSTITSYWNNFFKSS